MKKDPRLPKPLTDEQVEQFIKSQQEPLDDEWADMVRMWYSTYRRAYRKHPDLALAMHLNLQVFAEAAGV